MDDFQRVEESESVECGACGFEMSKSFSGVEGTDGHQEYLASELPGECPVCNRS